jgi:3(or 17)beta-hydroxysteroid dehydrogenase
MKVKGKVALVTGAGTGIGRATARLLAAEGAAVAVTDVNEESGAETAELIGAAGGRARFIPLDVCEEASWEAALAATASTLGPLGILVNNAGVALGGPLAETRLEDWRWAMSVNLDGVFLGTKHGMRAMRETGGSIVNVASALAVVGRPLCAATSASKGAVRLLTKTAALECAHLGCNVRVNAVLPGGVDTEIFEGQGWWPNSRGRSRKSEAREEIRRDTPMGRLADPDEVARAILFLASDDASFVTGAELAVDGGFTAG